MTPAAGSAAARWAEGLESWAIPEDIRAQAPEEPWGFPVEIFEWTPERAAEERALDTVSRRRALEVLPDGGTVLDVGVGGGRASLPLCPPGAVITGVDQGADLLAAFARAADAEGIAHREILGSWPDVAPQAEVADVAVCHHVFYNVADLGLFARALTDKAWYRVVVEVSAQHPQVNMNDAWRHFWGIERPTRPNAADVVALLEEMGLDVSGEESERPLASTHISRERHVTFARRRLCLPPERDPEVEPFVARNLERTSRRIMTIWWPGAGA